MTSTHQTATVMVVDDTPANLRLLDDMLRRQGLRVQLFPKASLALKAAQQHAPDLILLDIMMPEMDGFELCRQLQTHEQLRNVPIIFISALADADSKVRAFAAGGMDYVTKPFQEEEVLARVHTHLRLYQMQREREAHQQLLERLVRERTADLLRAQRVAHIGSWRLDLETQDLYWSPETYRLFGIPDRQALHLDDFVQRIHPEDQVRVLDEWNRALEGHHYDIEHRVVTDGPEIWVRERAEFEFDANGKATLAVGTVQDITELKKASLALETERTRLRNAIEAADAGTWEWYIPTGEVVLSERAATQIGYSLVDLPNLTIHDYQNWIHPDDWQLEQELTQQHLTGHLEKHDIEHRLRHRDGSWRWFRSLGRVIERTPTGDPLKLVGISIDITTYKSHQDQIEFITSHDPLTGLPNRAMFLELLRPIMAAAVTHDIQLAVANIDLDGFAPLNTQHGRDFGNRIIIEIGKRLVQTVREPHHVARIGGDEFAIILSNLRQEDAYLVPIQRLLHAIAQPLEIDQHTFDLTASIGVTLYPQGHKIEAEQLLRQSDQAMYLAKLAGKNRHHLFDPLKDESTRERFLRIDEIRNALHQRQFVLFYQPKVHLQHGDIVGFEALIRWQHPERGLLPPSQFIPLLEQHPLSIPLGDWVIETALAQLAAWNAQGLMTTVSVNIDSLQLQDTHFERRLLRQMAQQPTVMPQQLELEILETGALDNMAHVSSLIARLNDLGIHCALDDFGTGYSSLTFLKQLTASTIKIDQSFVRGMQDDAEHVAIVNSVLGLARSFERTTLAEGVETECLGSLLVELGCELGQGYAIARPMPASAVPDWITSWHAPLIWSQTRELIPQDVPTLLAEVEHRSWLKSLRHYTEHPDHHSRPINDVNHCRFGRWINKRSTQNRLGHLPGFDALNQLHQQLHDEAEQLMNRRPAPADQDWQAIETKSERILNLLRELRQTPFNTADSQLSVFN